MLYDADGNLVRRTVGTTIDSLLWDDFGQLKEVRRNGATLATFAYDGFGRRKRKTAGGVTVKYVWDGDQLRAEANASGTTQTYSYYPGLDQLHAVTKDGVTYYASIEPATGDVNGLINSSTNAVVATYNYTPWGEIESSTQTVAGLNSLRWKGLLYDSETGLYYMRARYYDPTIRRFISEDPIGLEGGINQYAFAGDDPVNNSDPSGLTSCFTYYQREGDLYHNGEHVLTDVIQTTVCIGGGGSSGNPLADGEGRFANTGFGVQRGAGGRTSAPPSNESPLREPRECAEKRLALGLTVLGDVGFFLGGGGAVIRGLSQAAKYGRIASEISATARLAKTNRLAMALANRGAALKVAAGGVVDATAGYYSYEGMQLTVTGVPNVDWRDFVPGFATAKALGEMRAACAE